MIIRETSQNKEKLKAFEQKHLSHTLITTSYAEKDNLECGKVVCEDEDERDPLEFIKS